MASAALVELCGGTPAMALSAVALTLKSMLGLVCDPVAGLVEIPCIKRNATATAMAFACAEMAFGRVESAIPADEVVAAMKRVGDSMPAALKETAEGGLAATPHGTGAVRTGVRPYGAGRGSRRLRRVPRLPVSAGAWQCSEIVMEKASSVFSAGLAVFSFIYRGSFFFVHS